MRLAKLCITLALVACGWHAPLAAALCARRADCHAATRAAVARAGALTRAAENDPANRHGHCATSAEGPRAASHAAPLDADPHAAHANSDAAHDGGENLSAARGDGHVSFAAVAALRAPDSSCDHCVVRQGDQPARVKSAAPSFAHEAQPAPAPARHLFTLPRPAPRARFAPTEHSPPRGRPLHLLNSTLLI